MPSDFAMRQSPPQVNRAFASLQNAMATKADQPSILKRLSAIALRSHKSQRADIQEMLKADLTQGGASATVHLLLGALAALNEDAETAILHFELGLKQQPEMWALMNNLAWSLAHADPPQNERALQLAQAAVSA